MKKFNIFIILTIVVLFLTYPTSALAVMQSLNGQTGQNQSFINDTNITISSTGNNHSLGWNGLLPISRGGTGAFSFTNGSIPFVSDSIFSESANFFWDDVNNRLGIGVSTPEAKLHIRSQGENSIKIEGDADVVIGDATSGQSIIFVNSNGSSLGTVSFGVFVSDGLSLTPFDLSSGIGVHGDGKVSIGNLQVPPNGTLQLFGTNPTLYIGDVGNVQLGQQTGCLVMGDSDGDGVTYITANNGVLTASVTKPLTCQ